MNKRAVDIRDNERELFLDRVMEKVREKEIQSESGWMFELAELICNYLVQTSQCGDVRVQGWGGADELAVFFLKEIEQPIYDQFSSCKAEGDFTAYMLLQRVIRQAGIPFLINMGRAETDKPQMIFGVQDREQIIEEDIIEK